MVRSDAPPAPAAPQAGPDVPAATPRPAHVPLLTLLTVTHLLVDAYATMVPALLPFWQARFGLTYGLSGLITGIANITSSVAQPVVGILTERGRDTRWVAVACFTATVGLCATGIAGSYPLFLLLVVIGGLGVSAFHPQGYKLTGLHGGSRQAVATSWFLVGGNVGVAVGPLVATAVVVRFGSPGTMFLLVPGLLLAATLYWLVPRWSGFGSPGLGSRLARPSSLPGQAQSRPAAPALSDVARLSLRRRSLAIGVLVALVAVRSTVSSGLTSFIPLYYVRIAGSGEEAASRVLAGMLLVGAVATIAGGYLADRWGRLRLLAVGLAATPPLLLLFLAAPAGSPAAVAALWGAGATLTSSFPITVVLAQELWHERRALASGLIVGFAFGLGGLLVPAVGLVADRWGLAPALRLLAGAPLVALILTAVLAALLLLPEAGNGRGRLGRLGRLSRPRATARSGR
ncbi:MAG TPA: MFS transporter [Chloroflexota bacterium]|nr:MFS transporter [Chloroflexota bacterium]